MDSTNDMGQKQIENNNLRVDIAVVQTDMRSMKEDLKDIKLNLQKSSEETRNVFAQILKDREKFSEDIDSKIISGDKALATSIDNLRDEHGKRIDALERYKDDQVAISTYKKTFQTAVIGALAAFILYIAENFIHLIQYIIKP